MGTQTELTYPVPVPLNSVRLLLYIQITTKNPSGSWVTQKSSFGIRFLSCLQVNNSLISSLIKYLCFLKKSRLWGIKYRDFLWFTHQMWLPDPHFLLLWLCWQTRNRFESTRSEVESLMRKMKENPHEHKSVSHHTMEGYLFVQEKRTYPQDLHGSHTHAYLLMYKSESDWWYVWHYFCEGCSSHGND